MSNIWAHVKYLGQILRFIFREMNTLLRYLKRFYKASWNIYKKSLKMYFNPLKSFTTLRVLRNIKRRLMLSLF